MAISLRLKFGGLVVVAAFWSLLIVYLVTSLEWVSPFSLLRPMKGTPDSEQDASDQTSSIAEAQTLETLKMDSHIIFQPTAKIPAVTHSNKDKEPDMETVQIVVTSDANSLGGLVATVNSVLTNTKHAVKFFLVISDGEIQHLRKWIESTKLHTMMYQLLPLSVLSNYLSFRGLTFVKIAIPELFPELKGKVVYLENDVIVQGDIWELFSAPFGEEKFGLFAEQCSTQSGGIRGMVQSKYSSFVNLRNSHLTDGRYKIDPFACPFSTGVFVANISRWKHENLSSKLQFWLMINKRKVKHGFIQCRLV